MAASIASSRMQNPDKGARYIGQLDTALCNGNWNEVPELARKVEKHSPWRACLSLAAQAETKIATASTRPGAGTTPSDLVDLVPHLETAIGASNTSEEDAFVASLALAKIYWLGKSHSAAFRVLPERELPPSANSNQPSVLGWLEVCNVQIPYMKISLLTALGQDSGIREAFQQAITTSTTTRSPELRKWTERLLAGVCLFYSENAINNPSTYTISESLRVFWAWNDFWSRSPPPSTPKNKASLLRIDVPRREVWGRYYDLLSTILQSGLMYNLNARSAEELLVFTEPQSAFEDNYCEARQNQYRELKRVESTYETILLQETQFPEASQDNTEVEEWINKAIANWLTLSGSWSDGEIGAGGKTQLGQGMLDILYRGATKTFHSTVILRELFNVHASLGDFELAMHAFDSYVDIVSKAKARAAKTGNHELGGDDDDLAVQTAANAIKMLCRYGSSIQAQKAVQIGDNIEQWLAAQSPQAPGEVDGHADDNYASSSKPLPHPTESSLTPSSLAAAYRAIGQAKAQWSRLTSSTEGRAQLQSEAIEMLKLSEEIDPESIETAYTLALVFADTRDIPAAITLLRSVLAMHPTDPNESEQVGDYTKQRKLIPMWHLLALCLTAKDQNDAAIRMCDAAFEQFGDPIALFGAGPSSSDPEKQGAASRASQGIVDQMEALEKETLLQTKMSQLSFIEVTEGAGVAVDMSDELLGLFTRLFGPTDEGKVELRQKPNIMVRSTSPEAQQKSGRSRSTSRLRSFAGSITGRLRSKSRQRAASRDGSTPAHADGSPLTVSVTNPDGSVSKVTPANKGVSKRHNKSTSLETENAASVFRRISQRARSRLANGDRVHDDNTSSLDNSKVVAPAVRASNENGTNEPEMIAVHNAAHDHWPPPAGHEESLPRQDVRLPAPQPGVIHKPELRLPMLQQRRHKIGLLVGVWLYIAQLYLHAEMLDDASGAIVEASKLAEALEVEIASHESSAREFATQGWGGAKSIDELMADIWAVNGDLASARKLNHKAAENYERALALYPDHASAIVGLSEILMDIYEEKLPAEESRPLLPPLTLPAGSLIDIDGLMAPAETNAAFNPSAAIPQPRAFDKDPSPASLNRLAARDRAYMLTSTLTRLGTGWDNSEAWLTLARAHELSKQVAKAKQALWWVVELEDNKPMRPWSCIGACGFTL